MKLAKHFTNHESVSLDKYLHEISKVKLLSAKEEIELDKAMDQEADEIVENMIHHKEHKKEDL